MATLERDAVKILIYNNDDIVEWQSWSSAAPVKKPKKLFFNKTGINLSYS